MEQALITYLLLKDPKWDYLVKKLPHLFVEEMNDGGMGSLRFIYSSTEAVRMKDEIARIDSLRDLDGIPLSITVNLGTDDNLYELDIFKGDFSPLQQFPHPPYKD
ncbi:hypothetical protein NAF17_17285 [Mucilaginibacter sp. RB4R14]|nr:hypothetical protein [Mucilaginibacter aurantiaciroseus]MCO5937304.1 hypothetical protein [Mucilaginibacter aurantiaciroseus]